ncbi:hypothetical protein OIU77_001413 [Salix suchowensis]|uniref:Ribosomal protein S18 n=1 Tax=Salix suchowensis TaxID=1278906 RepID=A0ABQ9B1A6_9ROSI|nr:hypothetical protein OIU77_001413 [Salix suchowensis]
MILRPFGRLKRKTTAPSGHSTTAATANAKNPRVGPSTLHRQGLLVVPHWIHTGTQVILLFIAINCPQQDENSTKPRLPRKTRNFSKNEMEQTSITRKKKEFFEK